MKYYVESLNEFFDTADEANKAEEKHLAEVKAEEEKKTKLADERKARATEVEDALKAAQDAEKKYWELRNKFVKDYGSFHISYKNNDNGISTFFEELFKVF